MKLLRDDFIVDEVLTREDRFVSELHTIPEVKRFRDDVLFFKKTTDMEELGGWLRQIDQKMESLIVEEGMAKVVEVVVRKLTTITAREKEGNYVSMVRSMIELCKELQNYTQKT